MNNKGFTFLELLGSLLILGLVTVLAFVTITGILKSYKNNVERVFVQKVGTAIGEYIGLNMNDINYTEMNNTYIIKDSVDGSRYCTNFVLKSDKLPLSLIEDYINKDIVNPNGKKECSVDDTSISYFIVYKDSEYVTYYELNLDCVTTSDNDGNDTYDLSTLPELKSSCSY